ESGFSVEATLKEHCLFEGKYIDVIIHAKFFSTKYNLRQANLSDVKLLFDWVNDSDVRLNSFNTELIKWEDHRVWYANKMESQSSLIFILEKENMALGQIRLDKEQDYWLIDYSIDRQHRGKG